jgi:hypothetical protein
MSDRHFPEIGEHAEWAFRLVFKLALEDGAYLTDPGCPYSPEFTGIISLAARGKTEQDHPRSPPPPMILITEELIDSNLDVDLYSVFSELKNYGKTIGDSDQTERMAYFRVATSLLERLVSARERALGVKQIRSFQDTVLAIMEEVLSPAQRTDVMDRLRSALARQSTDDDATPTTPSEDIQHAHE